AGGTIGGFIGPLLTKALVGTIGVAGVLAMSAVLLELAAFGVAGVRRAAARIAPIVQAPEADPPGAGNAWAGLVHVVRSRYLTAIVGYVLCTAVAATFIYLASLRITKGAFPDSVTRTDYFATISLWVAGVTFVFQSVVAAPLIGWLGPGLVLC